MSDDRLRPAEWVNAGLKALAGAGFTALRADSLAKSLGVSRGSFYWHFRDVGEFHRAVLQRWREVALEEIVAEVEAVAGDRLEALLRRAFTARSSLEVAVRAWATAAPEAKAAVAAVDAKRESYLRALLIETGLETNHATTRARIIYWTYLGYRLSSHRLDKQALERAIKDLSQLARSHE